MQRKDVEDQRRAVDHLRLQPLLERAELTWRELVVQDHRGRAGALHRPVDLIELALADEGGGVGVGSGLQHACDRFGPRRVGERRQLIEVCLHDPAAHSDEHRLLAHAGSPRRRERRLQGRGLVDAASSLVAVLRHGVMIVAMRCIASASRSSGTVSENRT